MLFPISASINPPRFPPLNQQKPNAGTSAKAVRVKALVISRNPQANTSWTTYDWWIASKCMCIYIYMYLHHIYVYLEFINIWGCRSIRTLQKYMLILQKCIHSDKNGNACLYKSHELIEPFWMLQASSPQQPFDWRLGSPFLGFQTYVKDSPDIPKWALVRQTLVMLTHSSITAPTISWSSGKLVHLDWENIGISRKFWVNIQHVWIEKHPFKRYVI